MNTPTKISSHNTMTYLPPRRLWLRPFAFMARCQSKDVVTQILDHDVRLLDVRVRFDPKTAQPFFAHGLMEYRADVYRTLLQACECARQLQQPLYIMLNLEWQKQSGLEFQQAHFRAFIQMLTDHLPLAASNVILCGGARKLDWQRIPDVDLPTAPARTQMVSSTTWKIWDDWFPYLYARLMNKTNRQKSYPTPFLALDFVHL